MQNEDLENTEAVEKAERHWSFLVEMIKPFYISAFIHGWKHGFIKANGESLSKDK